MEVWLDWDVFREALFAMLAGDNPYLIGSGHRRFFNPPWMLIIMLPLLLLPSLIGMILNAALSFAALIPITRKLGFNHRHYFLIVTNWVHLVGIVNGSVEWLPWLGLLMPAPWAILFLSIKPQSTIGFILFLLWREWKTKGWRGIALALAPTLALSLITVLLWGIPELPGSSNPANLTLFPWSLLLALPLLYFALRDDNQKFAAAAGPFATPYVTLHGYLPAFFASRRWPIMIALWLLSYIPLILVLIDVLKPA